MARTRWGETLRKAGRMDRIFDAVRDFIRREDPLFWLSLLIASVISFAFYLFVLFYVKVYNPV